MYAMIIDMSWLYVTATYLNLLTTYLLKKCYVVPKHLND